MSCPGRSTSKKKRAPRAFSEARRLLWLLLGQRDRQIAAEGLTLPLVTSGAAELDVEDEGLRLARLQDAEVPTCGQVEHRDESDRGHVAGPHADPELVVVECGVGGRRVGEVAPQVDGCRDRAVVADVEGLRDHLAGSQVVEVEVDRCAVVHVADAEHHGCGVDVDTSGVDVVERCERRDDGVDDDQGSNAQSANGSSASELLAGGGGGHGVPSLQQMLRRVNLNMYVLVDFFVSQQRHNDDHTL